MNNLEHRYNLLQEEKTLNERDFKNRNEINTKTIQNLKFDVDGLKNELDAINGDLQDLRIDNNGINELINNRSSEIARLKAELSDLFDSNNGLQADKRDLENNVIKTLSSLYVTIIYRSLKPKTKTVTFKATSITTTLRSKS